MNMNDLEYLSRIFSLKLFDFYGFCSRLFPGIDPKRDLTGNVKRFLINSGENFNTWFRTNKAEYTDYYVEGSLLDNFIVETKHGVAAFYERYCTAWESNYFVEFARFGNEEGYKEVFDHWYRFEEAYDEDDEDYDEED